MRLSTRFRKIIAIKPSSGICLFAKSRIATAEQRQQNQARFRNPGEYG
jgi:hypothetical protein